MHQVFSLWPAGRAPQSSEADYWQSFGQRLTFTTTEADPAGDVRFTQLSPSAAPSGVTADLDQEPVATNPDRAETHGGHYRSISGGDLFQLYTNRLHQADVSDALPADGSGRRVVASPDPLELTDERSPTYSPDGTRVAYSRQTADGGYEIVVAGAGGIDPRPLLAARGAGDVYTEPAWSPDGARIAFVEQHEIGKFGLSRPTHPDRRRCEGRRHCRRRTGC